MSEIEITQEDREAAANFYGKYLARPGEVPVEAAFRMGHVDESPLIQAFARHRHEASAEALEENKAWAEAVTAIMARCEALEDEAANEMAKDNTENSVGYWRGQKMTAKAIRRELHDLTRALRSGEREG